MQLALQKTSQNQAVDRQVSKCWVLRIKIPDWTIPPWVIPTIEILGFLLFVALADGLIGT